MRAFQFTMQTLLQHRQNLKDFALQEWHAAQSLLVELEEQLQLFRQELLDSMGNVELLKGESYFQKRSYAVVLRDRIEQQLEMINTQKEEVKTKQQGLQHRTQDCKALEILKEKQLQEFQKLRKKAEMSFVDELSTQAYFRKSKEGK